MTDFQLSLTGEQRELLSRILTQVLKEKRVEVHRTETDAFRKIVERHEALIEQILENLRQTATV